MKLEHRVRVAAPPERVWAYLMDIAKAARCIPGVESLEPLGEGRYRGKLRLQLGPIRMSFEGQLTIEARDDEGRRATLRGEGSDRSAGGGVRALVGMSLSGSTDIAISTDLQLAGRIGELGQPLIKRKADQMLDAFATNLQRELA